MNLLFFLLMGIPQAGANDCQELSTASGILRCVAVRHTEVQAQKAQVQSAGYNVEAADRRPNPELEVEGVKNKPSGLSTEVTLKFPIELGGKQSARTEVAQAEKSLSETHLKKVKDEALLATVQDLYRLRQIETELEQVSESSNTFDKITRHYRGSGRLNPEQDISLAAFTLALEESKLKEVALKSEKQEILLKLQKAVGHPLDLKKENLPVVKKDWPELSPKENKGTELKTFEQNLALSQAKLELEKSHSWPDLTIGPKVEIVTGAERETLYGAALSFPLPLFQANGAGRARAHSELSRDEIALNSARTYLDKEKDYLHELYKSTTQAVKLTVSESNIEAKHANLHRLIGRGIVSASLVIELHNHIFDYFENLHALELKAVQAQWKIYALQGRNLEEESL